MESYACKKCGSVDVFLKSNGTQTGLYCRDCNTWLKLEKQIKKMIYLLQMKQIKN